MSIDHFSNAIVAVTGTQGQINRTMNKLAGSVANMSKELANLKTAANECDALLAENKELKEEVERLKEQLKVVEPVSNKTGVQGLDGLFRDQPCPQGSDGEPYEYPVDGKGRKKQYVTENLVNLMEEEDLDENQNIKQRQVQQLLYLLTARQDEGRSEKPIK